MKDKTSFAYVEIHTIDVCCSVVAFVRVEGDYSGSPRYWEYDIKTPKTKEGEAVKVMVEHWLSDDINHAKMIADFEKHAKNKED